MPRFFVHIQRRGQRFDDREGLDASSIADVVIALELIVAELIATHGADAFAYADPIEVSDERGTVMMRSTIGATFAPNERFDLRLVGDST